MWQIDELLINVLTLGGVILLALLILAAIEIFAVR